VFRTLNSLKIKIRILKHTAVNDQTKNHSQGKLIRPDGPFKKYNVQIYLLKVENMSMLKGFKRHGAGGGSKLPKRSKGSGTKRKNKGSSTKKAQGQESRAQDRRDRRMLERSQIKRITKGGGGTRGNKATRPGRGKPAVSGSSGTRRNVLKLLNKKRPLAAAKKRPAAAGQANKWRARDMMMSQNTDTKPRSSRRVRPYRLKIWR
jgi:hypothetical protein